MTAATHAGHHDHSHSVPLWGLFLALLVLTGLEVGFYEYWRHTEEVIAGVKTYFLPKYVMVLIILVVLTLPKALIVLVYFMHLKFEKVLIVCLATIPFAMAVLAIVPILVDGNTLGSDRYSHDTKHGAFSVHHGHHDEDGHGHDADDEAAHTDDADGAAESTDDASGGGD